MSVCSGPIWRTKGVLSPVCCRKLKAEVCHEQERRKLVIVSVNRGHNWTKRTQEKIHLVKSCRGSRDQWFYRTKRVRTRVILPLGKGPFRKCFSERYMRSSSDDQKTFENDVTESENYFLCGGYLQSRARAFVCLKPMAFTRTSLWKLVLFKINVRSVSEGSR